MRAALAGAFAAGLWDGRPIAATRGARRSRHHVAEQGPCHALHLTLAVALATLARRRTGRATRALASAACIRQIHLHLVPHAEDRLTKRDVRGDEGVSAALHARGGASTLLLSTTKE